jgi:hypothetical protein
MSDPPDMPPGGAESRAVELLRLVGSETPAISARFTADLVSRARTQRAVAVPLRVLGTFVAALAIALAEAVRSGRGEPRP